MYDTAQLDIFFEVISSIRPSGKTLNFPLNRIVSKQKVRMELSILVYLLFGLIKKAGSVKRKYIMKSSSK